MLTTLGTYRNCVFLLNALCCFVTRHKKNTLKYHLVTIRPSFAVKMINCLHQAGPIGRQMERLGMSLTCSTITLSIAVLVIVSKMGLILYQTCCEN